MNKGMVVLALAVGLVATTIPLAVSVYLANRQSVEDEQQRALAIANEVRRRSDNVAEQIYAALAHLKQVDPDHSCSPASLAAMQAIDLGASYLQLVGHISDNHLRCSSQGLHEKGIYLGPPDYVSGKGYSIRRSVELVPGSGRHFFVSEVNGFAALVHRDLAIDVFASEADIGVGLVGYTSRQLVANRGDFSAEWLAHMPAQGSTHFFDGKHTIAMVRSTVGDFVAYASIPAQHLHGRMWELALWSLPLGLVVGVLLTVLILRTARAQSSMKAQLQTALARNELFLQYKPLFELATGRCCGVEAVVRWRRRDGAIVRPGLFLPVAESVGLMPAITERVLNLIGHDLRRLLQQRPEFWVAVNVSAIDIENPALPAQLQQLTAKLGLPPAQLLVEITERGFLHAEQVQPQVAAIRAVGCRVAVNDFGTGFSTLSHLERFTLDFLKIDRAFVSTVGTDAATSQVVQHIIAIGKALQLEMIAEGIDSQSQLEQMQRAGVRYAQGQWFGQPMTAADLAQQLNVSMAADASL
ncbi:EAL domain-containing protein [Permianibacter sp. IMCC34836]|uniref:EAL domain-containing protein n=1 Tax=Permianibacter fluminis TaxID=2738515 RepID=UPI001555FF77|nr:EAL domain-containing protein [Permianibacter fluminis]NQD36734.1 EAL domain-containing protein [Permianibacter fluminis]